MKTLTKTFARRVISALLVTIMVFSLGITSIVSTSAAEVEMAETGYVETTIYFTNNKKWSKCYVHYWGGSKSTEWPGTEIYWSFDDGYGNGIYTAKIPGDSTGVIFNNGNDASEGKFQTNNISASSITTYKKFVYGIGFYPTELQSGSNTNYGYETFTDYVKTTSLTNASVTAKGVGTTNDKVTLTATYTVNYNLTEPKVEFFIKGPSDADYVSMQNTTSKTYSFVPSVNGDYSYYVKVTCDGYNKSSSKNTFNVAPNASITGVTATQNGLAIAGETVTLDIGYTLNNVTGETVQLYLGDTLVESNYDSATKKLTFTAPETSGEQTYTVKVSGGDVEANKDVTVNVLPELFVNYTASPAAPYEGDEVTIALASNADEYGTDITYTLTAPDGNVVEPGEDGQYKVTQATHGTYKYTATVTVAGETATKDIILEFKEKKFSISQFYSNVGNEILENRDFTLFASSMSAPEGEEVTYYLTFPNGTKVENKKGIFPIRSKGLEGDVTSEEVVYTVHAVCGDKTTEEVTLKMTVKKDGGKYPIKLLFKCSTVKGYQPQIKVNGNSVTAEIETTIEVDNVTGHGISKYAWYSFYTQDDATYNQQINIEFKANRSAYYNVTYTLEVGTDDHTGVNGVDYYYLAIENLNAGRNAEVFNLSHWKEAERNWTESAVNMVFTEGKDVLPVEMSKNQLATTSFTYRYANIGDANLDGDVNVKDATFVQKTVAGMTRTDSLADFACDFNRDGRISIQDATAIQKQIAGL